MVDKKTKSDMEACGNQLQKGKNHTGRHRTKYIKQKMKESRMMQFEFIFLKSCRRLNTKEEEDDYFHTSTRILCFIFLNF